MEADASLEGLTDEELARRLQSQEEEAFYAATGGRAGSAAGDSGPGYGGLELQLEEDEEGGVDYDHLSYEDLSLLGDVAGAVSKGLAADALAALPVLTAREFLRTQRRGSSAAACSCAAQQHGSCGCAPAARAMCVVCQCDFEDSDVLKLLPACRHAYHAECISGWLAHNKVRSFFWGGGGGEREPSRIETTCSRACMRCSRATADVPHLPQGGAGAGRQGCDTAAAGRRSRQRCWSGRHGGHGRPTGCMMMKEWVCMRAAAL